MRAVLSLLFLVVSLSANADVYGDYQVVQTTTEARGNILRTETLVQVGANPANRFLMYRVSKDIPDDAKKGVVILAPSGVNENFRQYELQEGDDYASSFAGSLANRGVEVYGLSRRGSALAPGSCICQSGEANCRNAIPIFGPALGSLLNVVNPFYEPAAFPPNDPARTVDCSVAATWGLAADVQDLGYIRRRAEADLPGRKVVIGGLSNGGYQSYAAASAEPSAYDGLLIIDIGIASEVFENPTYQHPSSDCQFVTLAMALGYTVYRDDTLFRSTLLGDPGAVVTSLTKSNAYACTAPPALSALIFILTGAQVPPDFSGCRSPAELADLLAPYEAAPDPFVYVLTSQLLWGDGNQVFAAGDPSGGTLDHASRDLAAQMFLHGKDEYVSLARRRDSSCNYAGDTRFISNLGAFQGPVLTFEAGRGVGTRHGLLERLGSTDITQIVKPEFGHVDFNWSRHQERDLGEPAYAWLVTHVF